MFIEQGGHNLSLSPFMGDSALIALLSELQVYIRGWSIDISPLRGFFPTAPSARFAAHRGCLRTVQTVSFRLLAHDRPAKAQREWDNK